MSVMTDPQIQTFPCPEPAMADVRVGAGAIEVSVTEEPTVTVRVSPHDDSEASRTAAAETRVHFAGGRLSVETPQGSGWLLGRRNGRVRVELQLPASSRLRAHSGSADIRTAGRLADMVAHTGSGDVQVTETVGDVKVESGSGDVRAEGVDGALRVQTASGDVVASGITGRIVVDTASGDIKIESVTADVKARTASGDVHIGSVRAGAVDLSSVSGDVYVGVLTGTKVWLDISSISGSTRNDLDVSAEAPSEGTAVSLSLRTVSGDIRIARSLS